MKTLKIELTSKEAEYLNTLLHYELLFAKTVDKYAEDYKQVLWSIKKKLVEYWGKKVMEYDWGWWIENNAVNGSGLWLF